MKKRFFLKILMVFVMFLALSGCDKLALKKGDSFSRKVQVVSKLSMSIFNNADDKTTTMEISFDVTDVDSNGNATVVATIDKLEAQLSTLGYVFEYSSTRPEVNSKESKRKEMQEKFVNTFEKLVGKSYSAKVDKNGCVLELKGVDPEIKKYINGQANDKLTAENQAIMVLQEDRLKEYVSPGFYNGIASKQLAIDSFIGNNMVTVPSIPTFEAQRFVREAGELEKDTADWPQEAKKVYYNIKCEGLPGQLENDQEPPTNVDSKYKTNTHTAISVFGQGCIAYSKEGEFVKQFDRTVVEVLPERLKKTAGKNQKRKVRMFYLVDKKIDQLSSN